MATSSEWMNTKTAMEGLISEVNNHPDNTKAKNAKKKKSKRNSAKAEDKQIILPPQIFATGAPQQPATVNAQTPTVEQKAKPLTKPSGVKPPARVIGGTYNPIRRQIESAGQVNFAALAKREALGPSKAESEEIEPVDAPQPKPI